MVFLLGGGTPQTHHWGQGTVMALMTGEVETKIVIAKVGVEIL